MDYPFPGGWDSYPPSLVFPTHTFYCPKSPRTERDRRESRVFPPNHGVCVCVCVYKHVLEGKDGSWLPPLALQAPCSERPGFKAAGLVPTLDKIQLLQF